MRIVLQEPRPKRVLRFLVSGRTTAGLNSNLNTCGGRFIEASSGSAPGHMENEEHPTAPIPESLASHAAVNKAPARSIRFGGRPQRQARYS